jgi:hypothetical protein
MTQFEQGQLGRLPIIDFNHDIDIPSQGLYSSARRTRLCDGPFQVAIIIVIFRR